MARPAGSKGVETRERILDVARELFTHQGYDKTSLRDIAEQLQITKAALYYYFERKEDILMELHLRLHDVGVAVLEELEAAPDGPSRVAIWPRLAYEILDFMAENRELILLHSRNYSAIAGLEERMDHDGRDVEARFAKLMASPAIPLRERVRMASMIGMITEVFGDNAEAFAGVPSEQLVALLREAIDDLTGTEGAPAVG